VSAFSVNACKLREPKGEGGAQSEFSCLLFNCERESLITFLALCMHLEGSEESDFRLKITSACDGARFSA
jgi:hypothetical protein